MCSVVGKFRNEELHDSNKQPEYYWTPTNKPDIWILVELTS